MHAVIRTYSGQGAKELFDLLEKRKSDVESLIRSVKGFVSYSLVRTGDGGISVTVCQDKAGADDSVQKAKDWIGQEWVGHWRECTESVRRSGHSSIERMRSRRTIPNPERILPAREPYWRELAAAVFPPARE